MATPTKAPLSRRAPEERRDRIVEAARDLFDRQGFDDTSIADVAREAGVAVGTVYLSFPDKASLRIGVVNARKAEIADLIDRQREAGQGGLSDRLRALIDPLMDLMLSGPPAGMPPDCPRLEALGPSAVKAFAAVDDAIARYLDALVDAGLARDVDRRTAAALSSGLVTSAVEACRQGAVDRRVLVDELVDVLTRWWSP